MLRTFKVLRAFLLGDPTLRASAAQTAAKAALYVAIREAKISKMELARRLHCDEKEVRCLLDPRHPSKLPRIESALAAVGQKLAVGLQAAV